MRPFLLFPILQPLQVHPARPLILSALSYTAGDWTSSGVSSVSFYLLCLCQNVKDLLPDDGLEYRQRKRGEYRGRTDDLLHAMQAL